MSTPQTITIYGRVGKNPVLRRTKKQTPFCTFTVAEQVDGEEKPRWHNVVMWDKDSEHWAKVLRKGSSVFVRGRISEKEFKTDSGEIKGHKEVNAEAIGFLN
jgi:single-strand DNA-binding protein